ncbi:MAG: rhomboid family intramembrane serine protease [Spirochaetota bacterium]
MKKQGHVMNNSGRSIYNAWCFRLLILNIVIFVIQFFAEQYRMSYTVHGVDTQGPSVLTFYMGLIPALVADKGYVWQILTYMFLHDTTSIVHILFNMYALLIFGMPIEQEWGGKKFVFYYIFCGVVAGITIFLINYIDQGFGYYVPTIGASGAIFGLLLAFGVLFPDLQLMIFFVFPIKAKYLVILYGAIELFLQFSGTNSTVSHIGHLGGLAAGVIFFLFINRRSLKFKFKLKQASGIIKKKTAAKGPESHSKNEMMDINNTELQINILKKLKDTGIDSLSDDEFQYIKYIEIMTEDNDQSVICNEDDFNIEDDHCKNCEHFKVCFIREVKKYTGK